MKRTAASSWAAASPPASAAALPSARPEEAAHRRYAPAPLGPERVPAALGQEGSQLARNFVLSDYLKATQGLNVVKTVYMEVDVDRSSRRPRQSTSSTSASGPTRRWSPP